MVYYLISLAKNPDILVLLMLIQYSFRVPKYCVSLQGIQPIIQYHQRTSKYIVSSKILDPVLNLAQADPSPEFFPDIYKIFLSKERKSMEINCRTPAIQDKYSFFHLH